MVHRSGNGDFGLDPEQLEYLLKLVQAIYDARLIVALYNAVILLVVVGLAIWHWREMRSDRRKWRMRSSSLSPSSSSSSSSSTLDVERLPLLGGANKFQNKKKPSTATKRAVSSWLARQPAPLPIVNRVLPSNGTSVLVSAWIALNIFFHLFLLPFRWDFFFIFADRAGFIFIVNLPLLYLLSAKNQPLRLLTGYSYEALNVFHRRVGELMCLEAAVHFASMVVWQFVLEADWLKATTTPREYFTHPLILLGIGAFVSYELLFFTSLGSFRQRWYELFLASHVFLQVAALVFLWFHFYTSRPYVALALAIFLVDRLVWRFGLKRATITADVRILDDGETYLVSADWDLPPLLSSSEADDEKLRRWWQPSFLQRPRYSVLHGWQPTDHVFLSVPALGRSHTLQAHPFTIASAAPRRRHSPAPDANSATSGGPPQPPTHAWLSLLIRAHSGFTADLLRYAQTHSRVPVTMDGPYGSSHALDMLRASDCAVLVAGGSGIAVTFPLIWALLQDPGRGTESVEEEEEEEEEEDGKMMATGRGRRAVTRQTVHLLWVTHSRSHRSWVPQQELDELVALGLDLVIPEPTAEAGRPDVAGCVRAWIEGAQGRGEVGVVASGPDGLNRVVRNVCADAIGEGLDVRVAIEKFGW
ncbi:hypothetical protein B0T17DRAFT_605990 [Bombardia bombarda]|uniref:FAD-binding FR-type domain-containing protein n=1 Tax=Bombardia bombarda TaxID=252184 RepID=A0AA40C7R9_9PEZI|nr:hypothetical protein B0T17DRAFT_605990 [Bombardia bombarda]